MQVISPDLFSLVHEAERHLLVGRWLHNPAESDLYPTYRQLLATAQTHGNCRYWLLDMRGRSWPSAAFARWFSGPLAGQVVHEMGAPVFIAYLVDESRRAVIESVATDATLRQAAQVEFYPYFFDNEAAARDWLLYYQAHPDQTPPILPINESLRG